MHISQRADDCIGCPESAMKYIAMHAFYNARRRYDIHLLQVPFFCKLQSINTQYSVPVPVVLRRPKKRTSNKLANGMFLYIEVFFCLIKKPWFLSTSTISTPLRFRRTSGDSLRFLSTLLLPLHSVFAVISQLHLIPLHRRWLQARRRFEFDITRHLDPIHIGNIDLQRPYSKNTSKQCQENWNNMRTSRYVPFTQSL